MSGAFTHNLTLGEVKELMATSHSRLPVVFNSKGREARAYRPGQAGGDGAYGHAACLI